VWLFFVFVCVCLFVCVLCLLGVGACRPESHVLPTNCVVINPAHSIEHVQVSVS